MDKVVKIVNLKDKMSDVALWSSKSYQKRLNAIELLRKQYIKFNKMLNPELYEFVKLLIENQVEYIIVGGYTDGNQNDGYFSTAWLARG